MLCCYKFTAYAYSFHTSLYPFYQIYSMSHSMIILPLCVFLLSPFFCHVFILQYLFSSSLSSPSPHSPPSSSPFPSRSSSSSPTSICSFRYAKEEDMDVEGMPGIGEDSGWKQVRSHGPYALTTIDEKEMIIITI
jgi:hypothetical protein